MAEPINIDLELGKPKNNTVDGHEVDIVDEPHEVGLDEKPLPDPWPEEVEDINEPELPPKGLLKEELNTQAPPSTVGKDMQFQELQKELGEFLAVHIGKVVRMQTLLHEPRPFLRHRVPAPSDRDGDAFSGRASTGNIAIFSHMDLASGTKPTPADVHLNALDQFLAVHLENITLLQDSLQKGNGLAAPPLSTIAETNMDSSSQYNAQMQQFATIAILSILMTVFMLVYLSLSHLLIGTTRNRIPYGVGMLFFFLPLGLLLLTLALALWGVTSASWRRMRGMPEGALQSDFHLHLCRQMQFCAAIAMFLPVILLSFYMFAAIAFPVVFLVLLLAMSCLVVGSVFYRVPITFENVSTLILGTRRAGGHSECQPKRPTPRSRRSFY